MIIQEPFKEQPDHLVYTYSDQGKKIKQIETGIVYDSAVDVYPCRYTYEETDVPVTPPMEELV